MHEMAIAESIAEQVRGAIAPHGDPQVVSIRVRIGAMRAVVPEALEVSLAAVSLGTPLAGARLDVEAVPIRLHCRSCGETTESDDGLGWLCPSCGAVDVEMLSGMELMLESIEVEE